MPGAESVLVVEQHHCSRALLDADRIAGPIGANHPVRGQMLALGLRPLGWNAEHLPDRSWPIRPIKGQAWSRHRWQHVRATCDHFGRDGLEPAVTLLTTPSLGELLGHALRPLPPKESM